MIKRLVHHIVSYRLIIQHKGLFSQLMDTSAHLFCTTRFRIQVLTRTIVFCKLYLLYVRVRLINNLGVNVELIGDVRYPAVIREILIL